MKHQNIIDHFKNHDPVIHRVFQGLDLDDWIKPTKNHNGLYYFQRLCRSVIGQQLSGKAAATIFARFEKLFKNGVTPNNLLKTPDTILHEAGLSFAKASYVKNIAKAYLDNKMESHQQELVAPPQSPEKRNPSEAYPTSPKALLGAPSSLASPDRSLKRSRRRVKFDKFNELPDEEIVSELTSIKGVGPWTAEMFLMFTLQRENVFSFGDLGLKKGFIKLYKIKDPSKKQIEGVISKWEPYKTYGSIALWHSIDSND